MVFCSDFHLFRFHSVAILPLALKQTNKSRKSRFRSMLFKGHYHVQQAREEKAKRAGTGDYSEIIAHTITRIVGPPSQLQSTLVFAIMHPITGGNENISCIVFQEQVQFPFRKTFETMQVGIGCR